jgi:CIC family chloride channel protein
MLLCALVGLVAGVGAVVFYTMLSFAKFYLMNGLAGYHPMGPGGEPPLFGESDTPLNRWILFLLPALGGLVSGFIVFTFAPEAEGHGTDAAIDAYHNKAGVIRARVPFVKTIASAITIGTGGSAGREGPIAQIGASFGSMLGKWLGLAPQERRILMAAGMGAGIGAIFHAPLAGSLFAAEVMYRELDLEYEVLLPTVLASIVAYAVFALQFGWDTLFITPSFVFNNPMQLVGYMVLAIVVGLLSGLHVRIFYGVRDLFAKLSIPKYLKPAIGGLVVGLFAFFLPEAMGAGYGIIQQGLEQNWQPGSEYTIALFFGVVALGKMITTAFSIGSGGSGGVFGPSVVIGGALGGAVGILLAKLFPFLGVQPGAFVLVGMAGFFAAAANTPISTIIMVSEMTGNYHLLVPSMLTCFIAYALAKNWTIFEKQVPSRLQASAHMGDMMEAILLTLSVKEAVDCRNPSHVPCAKERDPVSKLLEIFSESEKASLPIVDDNDRLIGVVEGNHLRMIVSHPDLNPLLLASDLTQEAATVRPDDSLLVAVRLMALRGQEEVIVVDPKDERRILGILSHSDIVSSYFEVLGRKLAGSRAL